MEVVVRGPVIAWRGPAPHHFVAVPEEESAEIDAVARFVTYGWGAVPATVRLGATTWQTSLFPKDGRYLVPLKAAVRRREGVELDDVVELRVSVGEDGR